MLITVICMYSPVQIDVRYVSFCVVYASISNTKGSGPKSLNSTSTVASGVTSIVWSCRMVVPVQAPKNKKAINTVNKVLLFIAVCFYTIDIQVIYKRTKKMAHVATFFAIFVTLLVP